uniref:Tudor domain-containing protein 5 n=1 Tax=Timema bartmani TaxID=61472 RepID=A0A7R9ENM6_9NEOP|nr:unnamed protein product [Timema bartmani]
MSISHKPSCESNGLEVEKNFKNSVPSCEEDYAPSHDLGSNLSRGEEEQYINIVPAGGEDFDENEEAINTLEETLQFDEESRHESASKGFWEIYSSTPNQTNGNHKTDYLNFPKNDVPHWPQSNGYDSISSPRESECDSTAIVYSDLVNRKLQDNFRILLSDNPDGIWASELRRKYLKRFGSELDYFSYGFSSVTQLCLSLPEIFRYLKLDGINYKLFDFRKPIPKSALNQDYYTNKLKTPGIPSRITFNLSHLVEKFPDGLHYLKLGEIYEELYGQAVDYNEIGFDTLEDLLLTVSESIVQIHYINNEMFVYPGKKNSDYDDPPPILPRQGIEHILDRYPPESIDANHIIPKQQLPSDLKPNDTLNIEILEVYTPTKFYFNIFSNECSQALETLMEAMQNFYRTTTSKKLCMIPETIVEGHFCVAPYQLTDDVIEWTRAKINKIMSDTEVKVFFVDHGSTSLVKMKDLRYIHKDFADLPLQALPGKMSGIGPPYGQSNWPVEASKTFIKLLDSRPVVATVVEVNHKARSISALLVDTSSREDVVINQELVQLGLASVLPSLVNKVNQVELETEEDARGDQQLEESQTYEDTTTVISFVQAISSFYQ